MKKINNDLTKGLIIAIIFSIMLVGGIPILIIGASHSTILLVLGIVMVVLGFYGAPLLWIKVANIFPLKRMIICIEKENIKSAKELAIHLGINEKVAEESIKTCIKKMYLSGLIWDGTELKSNDKKGSKYKCPSCGAMLTKTNKQVKCNYCGADLSEINNG